MSNETTAITNTNTGSSQTPSSSLCVPPLWVQHKDAKGQVYLHNTATNETKWLWDTYTDPATKGVFRVNNVTGAKEWIKTSQNQNKIKKIETSTEKTKQVNHNTSNDSNSTSATTTDETSKTSTTNYSSAQKSGSPQLALLPDETLCVHKDGRKYAYNKVTKKSRWLTQTPSKITTASATSAPSPATTKPHNKMNRSQNQNHYHNHHNEKNTTNNTGKKVKHPPIPVPQATLLLQQSFRAHAARSEYPIARLVNLSRIWNHIQNTEGCTAKDIDRIEQVFQKCIQIAPLSSKELPQDLGTKLKDTLQELIALSEFYTQQMIKVDGVESHGNILVREQRKEVVKSVLGLADRTDVLKAKVQGYLKS